MKCDLMLLCSEVSILRGSQQAWTGAEAHMQLLPEHGRGRLGRAVVGPLLPSLVHLCSSVLENETFGAGDSGVKRTAT